MSNVTLSSECGENTLLTNVVQNALITQFNNTIDLFGFPVEIYYPKNEEKQAADIYNTTPNLKYQGPYASRAFVSWSPSMKQLKNFGIFTEEENPILIWLKNREDLPRITTRTLVRIVMGYAGKGTSIEYFELVSEGIKNAYNKVIISAWSMAPFRKPINGVEIVDV